MRKLIVLCAVGGLLSSCSTLDQSMRLGAATGSLAGAGASYMGEQAAGGTPTLASVSTGASIGLVVGLITSYLVHDSVVQDREESARKTEVYFGDLPPSPFVIPSNTRKG
ncbi:MAG: hypothetical protein EOP06_13325, partial [Proteobacteria bacterium]